MILCSEALRLPLVPPCTLSLRGVLHVARRSLRAGTGSACSPPPPGAQHEAWHAQGALSVTGRNQVELDTPNSSPSCLLFSLPHHPPGIETAFHKAEACSQATSTHSRNVQTSLQASPLLPGCTPGAVAALPWSSPRAGAGESPGLRSSAPPHPSTSGSAPRAADLHQLPITLANSRRSIN